MNAVKPDAFTLGNHEFDAGEKVLGEFVSIQCPITIHQC